jgi:hypothetical protein
MLQADGVGNATTMAQSIYRAFQGSSGATGQTTPCNNILDLAVHCQALGMSETDFGKFYNDVTTSTNTYFRGRVNVNTASADVLTALFEGLNNNINEQTAAGAAQSPTALKIPAASRPSGGSLTRWAATTRSSRRWRPARRTAVAVTSPRKVFNSPPTSRRSGRSGAATGA